MITLSKISSTDEFVTCDCVEIVQTAYTRQAEGRRAQRQKDPHRAEDGDHLEQNDEELKAVGAQTNLRMALTNAGVDGFEATRSRPVEMPAWSSSTPKIHWEGERDCQQVWARRPGTQARSAIGVRR